MTMTNGLNSNGNIRLNTRATQLKTSFNDTFQQQFRKGLGSGINLANNALSHVAKAIPGGAALSSAISADARFLNKGSSMGLDTRNGLSTNAIDGDVNSLRDDMVLSNQQLLEKQMEFSQIQAEYSLLSNLIKGKFDTLKRIGENVRP